MQERMAELVHRAEEREAVVELPAVLRVASDHEGAPQARVAGALQQVAQMLAESRMNGDQARRTRPELRS